MQTSKGNSSIRFTIWGQVEVLHPELRLVFSDCEEGDWQNFWMPLEKTQIIPYLLEVLDIGPVLRYNKTLHFV
jgi:hypothetical protein